MTDQFPSGYLQNGCFIVQNTSPQNKTITIFQYPINLGQQRNLLQIAGVSEGDIRASLLKGELNFKIRAGDIKVVCSDIELLQFNDAQKTFLQAAGVINGMQVGAAQMAVLRQQDIPLVGTINGVNTTFTIPSGVWIQSGSYKIDVYVNGVLQLLGDDYAIAESSSNGFDTIIMTIPPNTVNGIVDSLMADYYIDNSQS